MNTSIEKIKAEGKIAIIAMAFEILNDKQFSLQIGQKDFTIGVWANSKEVLVKLKRKIKYTFLNTQQSDFLHDITVNIITQKISPFDDWFYQHRKSSFYIPSKEEKEKIEFVKNHAGIPYRGFDFNVVEEQGSYRIAAINKHAFGKYSLDKKTGKMNTIMQGSYIPMPSPINASQLKDKDRLEEIRE